MLCPVCGQEMEHFGGIIWASVNGKPSKVGPRFQCADCKMVAEVNYQDPHKTRWFKQGQTYSPQAR